MSTTPFGDPNQGQEDEEFALDEEQQQALDESSDRFNIDEGCYFARLTDVEMAESKAGNPMWVWHFAITRGKYEGRDLRTFTSLTPKALFKLEEVGKALGIYVKGKPLKFKKSDVVGKEVVLDISTEEYNGRMNPTVNKVRSVEEAGHEVDDTGSAPGSDDIPF